MNEIGDVKCISPELRVYQYWHKLDFILDSWGDKQKSTLFGHSNLSAEDACNDAMKSADLLKEKVAGNYTAWEYTKPIREEILQVLNPENVVTRNVYGAEILNSVSMFFVDVDFITPPAISWWGRLRGRVRPTNPDYTLNIIKSGVIDQALKSYPVRLYRTHGGYRLIVQNCDLRPDSTQCRQIMKVLGSDYKYAWFCRMQNCFRARLTPKPGRINQPVRRFEWPESGDEYAARQNWVNSYDEKSGRFAVCRYLETMNGGELSDEMIKWHDRKTKAFSALPLA